MTNPDALTASDTARESNASAQADEAAPVVPVSFWAPFAQPVFLVIWSATLLGNIATAMRELAAAWLMTSLSLSSVAVGMVKAASSIPVMLLALPAGALADMVNRRTLNISVNTVLAVVTAGIGLATLTSSLTPTLLVAAVFVTGIGSALLQPTQQSLVPMLVPRHQMEQAVALNGMGLNVSRAVGPALAGLLVASLGTAAAFFANAFGYVIVVAAFLWWKAAGKPPAKVARESFPGAMAAGLRFVRHAPVLQRVLVRLAAFVFIASAYWTLLPVLVRRELAGTPGVYGNLLAAIGVGTVITALSLPWLRRKLTQDNAFRLALGVSGAALIALAYTPNAWVAAFIAVAIGASWLAGLTVANVSAQAQLPDWMRGRGMAIYLMVFAGAMTIGSLAWGWVADHATIRQALGAAAACAALGVAAFSRTPLPDQPPDLTPALHWWPEPQVQEAVAPGRGPVLVSIEYTINPASTGEFLRLLRDLSLERLRDGAYQWGVFEDVTRPGRHVETFLLSSWDEQQRLYHRISREDANREALVARFHVGQEPPEVRFLVAPATR
jgi:MFS family permease